LLNVTDWKASVLGFYTCNQQRKVKNIKLIIYRVPEPVLQSVPQLAVGEGHELVCHIANAMPIQNLTVTLCRGKETLHTKTFEQNDLAPVQVTYRLTAKRQHHG
ncbi:ICAM2 protein, partial [Herpetotheres cachinnans]|nr:ICAM2 protein [Herpetotheres cachinnans]